MMINSAMIIGMPTLLIGALKLGDRTLYLTEEQESWFGKDNTKYMSGHVYSYTTVLGLMRPITVYCPKKCSVIQFSILRTSRY